MSKFTLQFRRFALRHWRAMTAYVVLFVGLGAVLLARLGTILPGYSSAEYQTYQMSLQPHLLLHHPLNAPFYLLVYALHFVVPHNMLAVRLASVVIGWLTLVVFCGVLYAWQGTRAAVIGTLIFGTSGWFLHVARLGVPSVMFFGLLWLLVCGAWLRKRGAGLGVALGLILCGIFTYTPGMIWFMAVGVLWQWRTLDRAFKKNLGAVTFGSIALLGLLAPIGWNIYKTPQLARTLLCLPSKWNQPWHFLHNFYDVVLAIFARGQTNPEAWLGRLPLLNVFGLVMFVAGTYLYLQQARLARAKVFGAMAVIGAVVIAVSDGAIPITPLVPMVYLIVAAGSSYVFTAWLAVFPRNPIARALGVALFGAVLGAACYYNLRAYFIAWPQASVTQQVFTISPKQ